MGKQLIAPKTQLQAENLVRIEQRNFGKMLNDPPASDIGENVHYVENIHLHPDYGEGRTGSRLWSSLDLPYLRRGITAYRRGNRVYRVNGPEYQAGDVLGRYHVWPTGEHDEIIGYEGPSTVITRQSGDREAEGGCWIRSRVFGCFFHRTQRRIVFQIDTRFFVSDLLRTWQVEVQGVSYESPSTNKTYFYEDDDYVYAINPGGIFKLKINVENPYYYKINSPVISARITGVEETERLVFGRRYIVSQLKMTGDSYHGSRTGEESDSNVPLLTIEQESGTTEWNQDRVDYGEVFTEKAIGRGNETHGQLICDIGGVGLNEDITAWRDIENPAIRLEMNNEGLQDIVFDFDAIFSLDDLRAVIQRGIRQHWPSATVELQNIGTGRSRLLISTGQRNGFVMTYLLPATVGTDISNFDDDSGCGLRGVQGEAELDNAATYTEQSIVGDLALRDIDGVSPARKQSHWTHFGMHGTKNTGPAGTDPITGKGNNPEQFIHIDDVPVMKAFDASERMLTSPDSLITLHQGLFSWHDPGNIVRYQNGTTSEIQYLCDASGNRVYTPTSQYAIGDAGNVDRQSAVMGSTTVLTITRTGNLVTLVSGNRNFASGDVRKPLFFADGAVDWITEYVSPTQVRTLDSGTKVSMGAAIDPTSRKFCDVTTELLIAARQKSFTTNYRFWRMLPDSDLGVIVQGFLVVATAGENRVSYSPMAVAQKYLTGYYNPGYQYDDRFEDEISFLLSLPDKLAVICARSTWVTATNTPRSTTVPSVGVSVALLPLFTWIDNIGCVHIGSIRRIDVGLFSVITSEPAHRFFDGFKYSENLADKQIMDTLQELSVFTFSQYDDPSGLKMWGARET